MIIIRNETQNDITHINNIIEAAFCTARHTNHKEHLIVDALRNANQLSATIIAERDGKIIGHAAASPVFISSGQKNWYGLGPVAVDPKYQRVGVGTKLILAVLDQLRTNKGHGCVVLGDPNYYSRFGFKSEKQITLKDVPPEDFQVLLIKGSMPEGSVRYCDAFYL